uniref:Uncharacterized protein n=1 Tax=Anguilla anguilla TaxID=7936 RepID=A0A0E9TFT3_ANGAN
MIAVEGANCSHKILKATSALCRIKYTRSSGLEAEAGNWLGRGRPD